MSIPFWFFWVFLGFFGRGGAGVVFFTYMKIVYFYTVAVSSYSAGINQTASRVEADRRNVDTEKG